MDGVLMPDGGTVLITQGWTGDSKLETVIYKKAGSKESVGRVLGVSMVKEYTPIEKWPEIAQRYLDHQAKKFNEV